MKELIIKDLKVNEYHKKIEMNKCDKRRKIKNKDKMGR